MATKVDEHLIYRAEEKGGLPSNMCRMMKLWGWVRAMLLVNLAPLLIGFCISILEHLLSPPCGASGKPGDCPTPGTCDVNDSTLIWQGNKDYSIVYAWKLDLCNKNSMFVSQMASLMMCTSWAMTGGVMVYLYKHQKRIQKQALTLSLALTALFALLSTLVGKYPSFVLLQVLFGLASGSVYFISLFYMMDLAAPPDKEDVGWWAAWRAWLEVGGMLSTLIFFILGYWKLGNLCVSLASDWKGLYLSATVVALIGCVLMQAFLPESHEIAATLKDAESGYLLLSPESTDKAQDFHV